MEKLKPMSSSEFFLRNSLKIFLPSPNTTQTLLYIALSIAIGFIAWDSYLPMAILIPVIWSKSTTKKTAWLVGVFYHLTASRGIIFGVPVFFDSTVLHGIAFWAVAGLIQSLPYFLCSYVRNSYIAISVLLIALILPPIGIVGWANPLTAAGVIFPGYGFAGLFLTLCLIWFMVWLYNKNTILIGICAMAIIFYPLIIGSRVMGNIQIQGSITNFAGNPANLGDKFQRDYQKFIKTYNQYSGSEFKTLVLPESTGGIWTDSTKHLWSRWQRNLQKDQVVVLPTLLPESNKTLKTNNTLVEMKKDEFNVLYKARQSVPLAMWKPWSKDNVKNNWFENPVFEISGKKATALICYEAYLIWPVLQSFLSGNPEIILFVSNHWWSKNTSLLSIQKTCVNAWASLFATQVVSAINF